MPRIRVPSALSVEARKRIEQRKNSPVIKVPVGKLRMTTTDIRVIVPTALPVGSEGWSAFVSTDEEFGLEGGVQFTRSHYELTGPATATVYVERGEGASGAASVDVSTYGITGDCAMTAGTHYTAVSETLNWQDGEVGTKTVSVVVSSVPGSGLRLIGLQLTNPSTNVRVKTPYAFVMVDDGGVNSNATVISTSTGNVGDIVDVDETCSSVDEGITYPTHPYEPADSPGAIVVGDISGTVNSASAGDLIYCRGGEYFDNRRDSGQDAAGVNITNSGTHTAPIIVMSYPGEIAHLNQRYAFNSDGQGGASVSGFLIRNGASYFQVRNFHISRLSSTGIYTDDQAPTREIVVYGCHIHDIASSTVAEQGRDNVGATRMDTCTDAIICNNHFHHCYSGTDTSNPIDSKALGMSAGVHGYKHDRIWIHHNTMHTLRSAVQYKQSPLPVTNGAVVHNNLFYEFADYAFELNLQGSNQDPPQQNSFFRNVCDSSHSYACTAAAAPIGANPNDQSTGAYIYENTVIGCSWLWESYATDGVYVYSNNVDGADRVWSIVDDSQTTPHNSQITYNDYDNINNITQATGIYFIGRYDPGLVQLDSVTELQDYNQSLHDSIANTPDFANNCTETTPTYEDAANRDYRSTNILNTGYAGRAQGIGRNDVGEYSAVTT